MKAKYTSHNCHSNSPRKSSTIRRTDESSILNRKKWWTHIIAIIGDQLLLKKLRQYFYTYLNSIKLKQRFPFDAPTWSGGGIAIGINFARLSQGIIFFVHAAAGIGMVFEGFDSIVVIVTVFVVVSVVVLVVVVVVVVVVVLVVIVEDVVFVVPFCRCFGCSFRR